jgi:imidazolonepropionase-like amidohydrolase
VIALRAARLFDGERLAERPIVLIDGARIVDVAVEAPREAELVDLGDATLMPGLVDCHQHLVFNCVGTLEEQVTGVSDEDLAERARHNARQALRAGITTIRDVGDRGYVTLALRAEVDLPTLLCAGPPITVPGGHCWYLGGESPTDRLADVVAEHAARGCDLVKVMVSGGHLTPTYPMHESQFTTDEVRTIVTAAHERGLPVAAHCHGTASVRSAVDARVDTIEHCTFMDEHLQSQPDLDLLAEMRTVGIAMSATFGQLPGSDPPPVIKANFETMLRTAGDFAASGGRVVIGTDAGIAPPKPHDVAPYALANLLDAGMSRARSLRAMTADGADAIGLGDRKGRLTPGYDADVLAVAGDPFTGDGDLLTPVGVWRAGARVV